MEYFSSLILNPLCSAWIQPRMWQCLFGWHSMLLIHYQQFVNKILGNVTDFFKFILLKGVVSSHDVFVSFLIRKEKLFRSIHGMHENRVFFKFAANLYMCGGWTSFWDICWGGVERAHASNMIRWHQQECRHGETENHLLYTMAE